MSALPPLCRYCGRPIGKSTHAVYFGASTEKRDRFSTYLTAEQPATKAEAQRLVNQQVVSVSRDTPTMGGKIAWVTTWDGETYKDDLFCSMRHAADFGRACAEMEHLGQPRFAMPVYWAALNAQRAATAPSEGEP